MNTLAIIALVSSFLIGLVGIICGVIALAQVKRTGERGQSLAVTGIVVGALNVLGWIALAIFLTILFTGLFAVCSELGPGVHFLGSGRLTCG